MKKHINDIFKDNLNYYLDIQGKTQKDLADYLNVSTTMINYYVKGKNTPRMDKVDKICEFLNIKRTDLIGGNDFDKLESSSKGIKIPVLGSVAAGVPIEAIEDVIDYEEISKQLAATGNFFALQIKGDSMSPRICDNDVVIVKQQNEVENGEIAIVLVNGDDATCKKVIKKDTGIMLMPFNREFEPMFFDWSEVQKLPVTIIGKVVELRGKF